MAAFASELRALRATAGNPTYRDMARAALFSSSVLSSAASGRRLPTLQVALAFVAACGGDRETWRRRWLAVAGEHVEPVAPRRADDSARPRLPRPAQLPLRPRGFVGRAAELRALAARTPAPMVISGPVGVGKSELALRHAHDIACQMVDGQLYADFAAFPDAEAGGAAVLAGFLAALGVPASALPDSLDQRAGLYRSLLAERRIVVLMDNVRDERQVRPLLAENRSSTTVLVGRTSLPGLRAVRRIRLDVPSRAESVALLAAAADERVAADPDSADRLAQCCGDLPLAMDILARKLAARPHIPLRLVVSRMAEPGALWEWLRIGDLSVWESLADACRDLDSAARTLLTRLAWLPAQEPVVWACGRVTGQAARVGDELVVDLAEAGVLRRCEEDGAFRLDPLVRAYARKSSVRIGEPRSAMDDVRELIAH